MRPQVDDKLAERIEEVYVLYGYRTKASFVNDAIRRRLAELDELNPDEDE